MTTTQYTAAGVIDAVRLELQNSTSADSAFEDGFAKGAKWALANVEGRMKRADDLFRIMCDELTVIKELRAKLAIAEAGRDKLEAAIRTIRLSLHVAESMALLSDTLWTTGVQNWTLFDFIDDALGIEGNENAALAQQEQPNG
jgi:hypothetical protein